MSQDTIALHLRALNAVRRFFGKPERRYLTDREWREFMRSKIPQPKHPAAAERRDDPTSAADSGPITFPVPSARWGKLAIANPFRCMHNISLDDHCEECEQINDAYSDASREMVEGGL